MKNRTIKEILENKTTPLIRMDLQHFASSGSGDDEDDDSGDDEPDDDSGDDDDDDDAGEPEKKFTQEDMTRTATREKKQGRKSAFKEMGFKDEKEAKAELEEFRKWKESQLTDEQKQQKQIDDANNSKSDAEKRAQDAEEKLAVVIAGVRKDSIDDVLAIARGRVTDEKTLDDVLEEMKKADRYKSFFADEDAPGSNGTGGNLGHGKGRSKTENIGERLAKKASGNSPKKSSYF